MSSGLVVAGLALAFVPYLLVLAAEAVEAVAKAARKAKADEAEAVA